MTARSRLEQNHDIRFSRQSRSLPYNVIGHVHGICHKLCELSENVRTLFPSLLRPGLEGFMCKLDGFIGLINSTIGDLVEGFASGWIGDGKSRACLCIYPSAIYETLCLPEPFIADLQIYGNVVCQLACVSHPNAEASHDLPAQGYGTSIHFDRSLCVRSCYMLLLLL